MFDRFADALETEKAAVAGRSPGIDPDPCLRPRHFRPNRRILDEDARDLFAFRVSFTIV